MDAGRCAAVGPSGAGGFERRSTHCVNNLLSIAPAARLAQELVFSFRARGVPAPVRNAGRGCLRRVPAFSSSFPHCAPRVRGGGSDEDKLHSRGLRSRPRYRILKHHDRCSSPFGCILPIFRGYPASMTRFVFHVWDANPGRWNQGGKCKGKAGGHGLIEWQSWASHHQFVTGVTCRSATRLPAT